jgi:hypothetical protein
MPSKDPQPLTEAEAAVEVATEPYEPPRLELLGDVHAKTLLTAP